MVYKDLNDYEIIYLIKENNEEAKNLLFEKYKPFIEVTARRMSHYISGMGLELSDLIQEGLLALNTAINTFNETMDNTFYTYAKTCIERKMISLIVKHKSNKHKALNDSIPFEVSDDEGERLLFGSILEDNSLNPENLIINREKEVGIIESIRDGLTDLEGQVFDLKLSGFNYKEIAEMLDKSTKTIDNALQRIKAKAKEKIDSSE